MENPLPELNRISSSVIITSPHVRNPVERFGEGHDSASSRGNQDESKRIAVICDRKGSFLAMRELRKLNAWSRQSETSASVKGRRDADAISLRAVWSYALR